MLYPLRAPLLLALPVLLASCGYAPLYQAKQGAGPVVVGQVEVQNPQRLPGERRVAQTIAQRLKQDFPATNPNFDTVRVSVREDTSALAVERTATVQRAALTLSADVILTAPDGTDLLRTQLSTNTAYNVENTPFSTESGKAFARQTAARNLGEEISRRLTLYYRQRQVAPELVSAPQQP